MCVCLCVIISSYHFSGFNLKEVDKILFTSSLKWQSWWTSVTNTNSPLNSCFRSNAWWFWYRAQSSSTLVFWSRFTPVYINLSLLRVLCKLQAKIFCSLHTPEQKKRKLDFDFTARAARPRSFTHGIVGIAHCSLVSRFATAGPGAATAPLLARGDGGRHQR